MPAALARLEALVGLALDRALGRAAASPLRAALLVGLVALAAMLPGLAALPVTDRDEARFAQASRQMLETGDLVDIRFQDAPRWKKPVGIYWLQAASAEVFGGGAGAGIWAYRLPSAAAGALSALLVVWAAWPLIGARGAVLSGLMVATTLLAVVEAHIAKTDAALMAAAVATFGALARLTAAPGAGRASAGRGTALVFWLAIAVAILLKGPVVPVIVVLTLGALWAAGRRPGWRVFRPGAGLALACLIVAPWLVAIWQASDGAFFAEALGRDLGAKLVEGQESHWGPPGLYLLLVWVTFWPWAALIPAAAPWLWRQRRAGWAVLLAGWVVPFWLVLEAVPTKLPHYVLPLYPALAIALAAWAAGEHDLPPDPQPGRWARRAGAALVLVPAILLALLVIFLPVLLSRPGVLEALLGDMPGVLPSRPSWPAALLGLLGLAAAFLAARAALAGRVLAQAGAGIAAAILLYPAALALALPALRTGFPSPELARLVMQYRPCASGPAFSVGYHEPSLVFLTETGIRLAEPEAAVAALAGDPGALVLVEDRWRAILGEDAFAGAVMRAEISYFNYNRGKAETARLMTPDDARWESCAG